MTKLCSYFPLPGFSRKYDIAAFFCIIFSWLWVSGVCDFFYEIFFLLLSQFFVLCVALCLFFLSRCIRRVTLTKWLLGWMRG